MSRATTTQQRGGQKYADLSPPPSDLLRVLPIAWTQQKPPDAVHAASLLGCRAEWRRMEMDLEGQVENNSAWPVYEYRERYKNIFVPQCFLHYKDSMTIYTYWWEKNIYYILAPDHIRCGNWKVKLHALKELNSLNWEDFFSLPFFFPLTFKPQQDPQELIFSLLCMLEF